MGSGEDMDDELKASKPAAAQSLFERLKRAREADEPKVPVTRRTVDLYDDFSVEVRVTPYRDDETDVIELSIDLWMSLEGHPHRWSISGWFENRDYFQKHLKDYLIFYCPKPEEVWQTCRKFTDDNGKPYFEH
jgi:hypothetical protein